MINFENDYIIYQNPEYGDFKVKRILAATETGNNLATHEYGNVFIFRVDNITSNITEELKRLFILIDSDQKKQTLFVTNFVIFDLYIVEKLLEILSNVGEVVGIYIWKQPTHFELHGPITTFDDATLYSEPLCIVHQDKNIGSFITRPIFADDALGKFLLRNRHGYIVKYVAANLIDNFLSNKFFHQLFDINLEEKTFITKMIIPSAIHLDLYADLLLKHNVVLDHILPVELL